MFDYLIVNGTVVDGTRRSGYRADVAIAADRIARIGELQDVEARTTIDASDCVVAPGFIDVHNHSEGWLLKDPHFSVKTLQGFTSEILMSDGISYAPLTPQTAPEIILYLRALNGLDEVEYTGWRTIGEFMRLLDGRASANTLPLIPYANLRAIAAGWGSAPPGPDQMAMICRMIGEGMEQGAAGLSTGLDYVAQCFASTDELVQACAALRPHHGLYVTHIRYALGRLEGLKEAVEIGRRAGVPLHISHLMGRSIQESEALLDYIDRVAGHEVDFSFDSIPYCSASTLLLSQLPLGAWEEGPSAALRRMRDSALQEAFAAKLADLRLDHYCIAHIPDRKYAHLQGTTLAQYIAERDEPPVQSVLDLLEETDMAVLMVYQYGAGNAPAWPFLVHPCGMLGTDGIYFPDGCIHPRMYGSSARMLGSLVREQKLFALEEAVHKMTGQPAKRFGLRQRGVLAEGCFADVVIFDPARVSDRATYSSPHQPSEGFEHVWVNGCPVVRAGKAMDAAAPPGRALKYGE
jgi:N-acyl-D-amino-acid deacylase